MTRIARLTDALRGRGKALVVLGAAAAVAGTGTASLATSAHAATARPAALRSSAASAVTAGFGNATRESAGVLTAAVVQAQRATESVLQSAAKAPVKVTAAVQHKAAPAKPAAAAKRSAPTKRAAPAKPYEIYDSVTPSQLPAHHEAAVYADGAYAASPAQVAGRKALWIDTNGSDSKANVLDVEPGDATPALAATWAYNRLHAQPDALARIYTMKSDWSAVRAAVAKLPAKMQEHIRWWIADPTGVPHMVPGAQATQWYWGQNYDISTATAQF